MKETDKPDQDRTNYEEPLVIEEEKSEEITIDKEEIIEAHTFKDNTYKDYTYKDYTESNLGFENFADFFKNIGKKKDESYSGTKLTSKTIETADGCPQRSFDCSAS